jgi:hypothetical protein
MYVKSREAARTSDEMALWRESRKQNAECAAAIKDAIGRHFDGMYLGEECLSEVVSAFSYERTAWVLAATVAYKDYDGRFSRNNKAWGKQTEIACDSANYEFVVNSHPAVLDGFIDQFRQECHQREMDHSFAPVMM